MVAEIHGFCRNLFLEPRPTGLLFRTRAHGIDCSAVGIKIRIPKCSAGVGSAGRHAITEIYGAVYNYLADYLSYQSHACLGQQTDVVCSATTAGNWSGFRWTGPPWVFNHDYQPLRPTECATYNHGRGLEASIHGGWGDHPG